MSAPVSLRYWTADRIMRLIIGLVITGFVLVVLDVVGLGAEGRGEKEKGGR